MIWLAENFTKTQRGFGGANAAVGAPIVAEPELALPNSSTRVYHAHDDGVVYCLDGRSGEILWSFGEHDRFCKRTALGFKLMALCFRHGGIDRGVHQLGLARAADCADGRRRDAPAAAAPGLCELQRASGMLAAHFR